VWIRPVAGGEVKWYDLGKGRVSKIAFDPTGTRLAVSDLLGPSRVIDLTTGKDVWVSKNGGPGIPIDYSPDGKYVATVEGPGATAICIRDAETGEPKRTINFHTAPVLALAFSRDSSRLASGSRDTRAAVWNVATGKKELEIRNHDHLVNGVVFSPDGKRLVDASGDKTVCIYDVRSGAEALTLKGHTAPVIGAAFSPSANYLATCGFDGTIRLWAAPLDITAVVPKEADQPHFDN
jgi:WD40 repeat protein